MVVCVGNDNEAEQRVPLHDGRSAAVVPMPLAAVVMAATFAAVVWKRLRSDAAARLYAADLCRQCWRHHSQRWCWWGGWWGVRGNGNRGDATQRTCGGR